MDERSVSIPLSVDWNQDEIVTVANFFTQIEYAYGSGVKAGDVKDAYEAFKAVVPSKSEEKTHFKAYDDQANTNTWTVVKRALDEEREYRITM
ncbi:hypothetical protein JCM19037_2482 [Geomicrobium sp. JCM 19037]|uniref:UPF0223 family protein n=1 Tax=unclassified Geomicrobium TaxID=2628951 RepID=UPI00045F2934|nr:UPF0223 family protein [Geomicrobium sp. JCM 19037]GAK04108.1 hypothetical protein JCM19037_2482 [Geomicrobium sp. JCM 19037]